MNTNNKNFLRWLVIVGFGGYDICVLVEAIPILVGRDDVHWAARWLFLAPLIALFSFVFFALSYFIFTRQYRRLSTLICVVAAYTVFGCIISIPEWVGLIDWMDSPRSDEEMLVGAAICSAALLPAWYSARWVYRRGRAYALRFVDHETEPQRAT